jgi:hypothetical protein
MISAINNTSKACEKVQELTKRMDTVVKVVAVAMLLFSLVKLLTAIYAIGLGPLVWPCVGVFWAYKLLKEA